MAGAEHAAREEFIVTLTLSIAIGAFLTTVARRLDLPAIVLLLVGGVLAGPVGFGIVNPEALGDSLQIIVAFSIGLILFEGGLTLDAVGYRSAGSLIKRLLTLGVGITWLGGALAIYLIFQTSIPFALLAASLTIVTGPTVISPLLKRIRLKPNLHHTLHWEGVLIDPIGVFIAILCFELVVENMGDRALSNLGLRIAAGVLIGFVGGHAIRYLIKKRWVPENLINVFVFGAAAFIYGITEGLIAEAGLLTVTVAGLTMGMSGVREVKKIRQFKADVVDLLIGMLFILLSARLEPSQFVEFGWAGLLLVAVLIFLVRPAAIFACTTGLEMTWREKAFLSWVAPRGIVAASIASLFALALQERGGMENPLFLESFTYAVIVCTIVLQGFSAGWVAKILKLRQPPPKGWLLAGAHPFSRIIAGFLLDTAKVKVLLVDGNRKSVGEARAAGYRAMYTDARDVEAIERRGELPGIGRLLALTDNEDLNALLCRRWAEPFGNDNVYRWHSGKGHSQEDDTPYGKAVWMRLPKPSLIVTELENGQARLVRGTYEPDRQPQAVGSDRGAGEEKAANLPKKPLIAMLGEELIVDPTQKQMEDAVEEGLPVKWLSLKREADYLLAALDRKMILDLEMDDAQEVVKRLVHRVGERENLLDEDALLPDILAREKTHPTLLGHGVAVPQAVVEGLHHRTCAIARLKTEIPYMGEGSEPVRLVFLLLSPTGHRERHLATLGEIARMVSDYTAREKLIEAADAEAVLEVIREYKPLRLQDDEATKYPSAIRQRGEHSTEEKENGEDKSESQKLSS